jgi:hypothetical protein
LVFWTKKNLATLVPDRSFQLRLVVEENLYENNFPNIVISSNLAPRHDPRDREAAEEELGVVPVSGVLEQLRRLQEDVGAVVEQKDQGANLGPMLRFLKYFRKKMVKIFAFLTQNKKS